MNVREKIIRRVNRYVQKSGMSKETKLFSENTVLAIDVAKKVVQIASEKDKSYAQLKTIQDRLHRVLDILQEE